MKAQLSLELLLEEAGAFARLESVHSEASIYGVTDGKAIGTYFEHKFQDYLIERYSYEQGSSASGCESDKHDGYEKANAKNRIWRFSDPGRLVE